MEFDFTFFLIRPVWLILRWALCVTDEWMYVIHCSTICLTLGHFDFNIRMRLKKICFLIINKDQNQILNGPTNKCSPHSQSLMLNISIVVKKNKKTLKTQKTTTLYWVTCSYIMMNTSNVICTLICRQKVEHGITPALSFSSDGCIRSLSVASEDVIQYASCCGWETLVLR